MMVEEMEVVVGVGCPSYATRADLTVFSLELIYRIVMFLFGLMK